jgi:hypothetical protein
MVWDLRQRQVQHRDVVGGGVPSAVAGPQHTGQRLPGGVEETQQGVIAETLLPGLGRGLLVGVADHDRGVDVQHEPRDREPAHRREGKPAGLGRLRPRHLPRPSPRRPDALQGRDVDTVQHPPRGRVGGDRPEQLTLDVVEGAGFGAGFDGGDELFHLA